MLLCAALWILTPHFLTVSNLVNVVEQTSINAIVAVGMTFVILSGGIDLSVGSLVALAGVVLGTSLQDGQPLAVALALALAAGAAAGLGNGALIAWGGLPPFIVTLGHDEHRPRRGAAVHRGTAGVGVRRVVSGARHRPRRLRAGAGDRDGDRLRRGAFRADAHDVRPLRLRDRRQRRSDAPLRRRRPLSQDDDLRRVRA